MDRSGKTGLLGDRLPGICDISVTNVCNAACDFCGFARDKGLVTDRRFISRAALAQALPILRRSGIRYVNFQGGEPLQHPQIVDLVADAAGAGFKTGLITNGWLLPRRIRPLIAAGLESLSVSIDSASIELHERNRGLKGVDERIRRGVSIARGHRLPVLASVTVSHITQIDRIPELLRSIGFDAVNFSYPRSTPTTSSSLAYGETSKLVDFERGQLLEAFDAILAVKKRFPVLNPTASLLEMKRHVRGEAEIFPCVGGYKYFYLDWNLVVWRCETWNEPLGNILDFDRLPVMRDRCTACMLNCNRDASAMLHAGVAVAEAATDLAGGHPWAALKRIARSSVAQSMLALAENARVLFRLARPRGRRNHRLARPDGHNGRAAPPAQSVGKIQAR
jgi:MoaA/NifB/PqqE/SkfB family radical SAM enzyme